MFQRPRSAFTMVEVVIVVAIIGIIAAFGSLGFIKWKRLREDQALLGRAAALDQAQLIYLSRHPGLSLVSAGADQEIREIVTELTHTGATPIDPSIESILQVATFETSERPAKVSYQGREITFPTIQP